MTSARGKEEKSITKITGTDIKLDGCRIEIIIVRSIVPIIIIICNIFCHQLSDAFISRCTISSHFSVFLFFLSPLPLSTYFCTFCLRRPHQTPCTYRQHNSHVTSKEREEDDDGEETMRIDVAEGIAWREKE